MRRAVAAATSGALAFEACGLAFYNLVLGLAISRQHMSLAGLTPRAMSTGTFAAGVLGGLFLLLCAGVAVRVALVDRPPRRWARMMLVVCTVLNGILGAAAVGILGWAEFTGTMVILGLVVLTLLMYPGRPADLDPPASMGEPVA